MASLEMARLFSTVVVGLMLKEVVVNVGLEASGVVDSYQQDVRNDQVLKRRNASIDRLDIPRRRKTHDMRTQGGMYT